MGRADPRPEAEGQDLCLSQDRPTVEDMLHLRIRPVPPTGGPEDRPDHHRSDVGQPLPRCVTERVRTSADVLAALLDVEGRSRASIDDLEWADAVAARILARGGGARWCGCSGAPGS